MFTNRLVLVVLCLFATACASVSPPATVEPSKMKSRAAVSWPDWPGCPQMLNVEPFDTSSNCASEPSNDRVRGGQVVQWGGSEYLFAAHGNEIKVYNLDDPASPTPGAQSHFNVDNQGDSDYDLMQFAVCDDCRYGAAWYKMGMVLFDLGTAGVPVFTNKQIYYGYTHTFGGVTWREAGQQRLITSAWPTDECSASSVWTINRTTGLDLVHCLEASRPILAGGGMRDGDRPEWLYVADSSTRIFLFEVFADRVEARGQMPWNAKFIYGRAGMSLEGNRVASASNAGAAVWDVTTPTAPVKLYDVPGDFDQVNLRDDRLFASLGGVKHTEAVFDLAQGAPAPLEQDFWSSTEPWNYSSSACTAIQAGVWGKDGHLLLARFAKLQDADYDCRNAMPQVGIFVDGFESGNAAAWGP